MNKIRVGVLMGGLSLENEVSFNSGRTICDHLDTNLYDIVPIFQSKNNLLYLLPWHFLHRGKTSDFENRLEIESKKTNWDDLPKLIDFMYLAVHGQFAEDGSVQSILELLKIPYSGSNLHSSALSSSKYFHQKILNINGIKTPESILIKNINDENINKFIENKKFPLILKPSDEGSSLGIKIINNFNELKNGTEEINFLFKKEKDILLQEHINGSEFSCILIQKDKNWIALEPTEIVHKNINYIFNYNDKYMPGASIKYTPGRFSNNEILKIKQTCLSIAKILNSSGILRIDGFLNEKKEIIILESNVFPGTAQSSFTFIQASLAGFSHSELINNLIKESLMDNEKLKGKIMNKNENISDKDKKKIAVLFGGSCNEKEISLESGKNVFYKLSKNKYIPDPIFMSKDESFYKINLNQLVKDNTNEINLSLKEEQKIKISDFKNYDFVFLALHGGKGEDGTIQGALKILQIPHNGSGILASSICMNKNLSLSLLKNEGFDIPNGFLLKKEDFEKLENILKKNNLNYPLITKPNDDGCSFMVKISLNLNELKDGISEIFNNDKNECLIEECIDGMELTVGVIGNNENEIIVLPPTFIPKKCNILSLEEKFLPGEGENITPAPLSKKRIEFIKSTIKNAYLFLNCKGYARIDCFFIPKEKACSEKDKLVIIEFNSLPALTPSTCLFHQASEINIKPMELIDKIIEFGLKEYTY